MIVLIVLVLYLWFGWQFQILRNHFLESLETACEESLLEDEDIIVLTVGHEHLVKSSQVLVVILVHHAKHIHSVAFDLLDWIAIECKALQVFELLKLLGLLQTGDVVSMEIQSFKFGEFE